VHPLGGEFSFKHCYEVILILIRLNRKKKIYFGGYSMGYYSYYPPYVTVGEKREKAAKKLAQLRKKDPNIQPVVIEGSALAKTWWGKSWNKNLESYADYSNRIGRGRSYVRNGAVLDLKIQPGEVKALVQGSESKPYNVIIKIKPIQKNNWIKIKASCQGQLESLPELLEGNFPKTLSAIFMAKGEGLFPSSDEIKLSCSCPGLGQHVQTCGCNIIWNRRPAR
jgi:hypothetical protein